MKRGFLLMVGAMLGLRSAPSAAEPGYLGGWLITEARIAPWARPGHDAFDAEEQRRLIGSKVIYRKTRIEAPAPLGCDKPRYRTHRYPADYLFQSDLTAPAEQARALGFARPMTPTLETGCEGSIDFHFADPATAMFALNNMIYTLRRLPATR